MFVATDIPFLWLHLYPGPSSSDIPLSNFLLFLNNGSHAEKFTFEYSARNIHIPSDNQYLKCFIEQVEDMVRRMRWKPWYYLNPNKGNNAIEILK